AHPLIVLRPSTNLTVPDGTEKPVWLGLMVDVYLAFAPTFTAELATRSVVDVESVLTARASPALVEPATFVPGVGVKTAVSCSGDVVAEKDVTQVTIWPDVETGSSAHP